jgi:carbon catabolite-derepressing protein kinase
MENPELESFLATSPPVEPNYPNFPGSPVRSNRANTDIKPLTPTRSEPHRSSRTLSDAPVPQEEAPRVSNVRVLNTSLPYIHADLLDRRREAREAGKDPDLAFHPSQMTESPTNGDPLPLIPEAKIDPKTKKWLVRPKEEQDATARALKPHSRSVTSMSELRDKKDRPESMTAAHPPSSHGATKSKAKRWQFGIRSRNAPFEAMKCLYNALQAQNADWEIIPALASDADTNGEEEKDSLPPPPPELAPGERYSVLQSRFPHMPSDYYVTRDPWFIRARLLKKGMYAPGEAPILSAQNSSINLVSEQQIRKHVEHMGGYLSEDFANGLAAGSTPDSQPGSGVNTRPSSSVGDQAAAGQDAFTGPGHQPNRTRSSSTMGTKEPNPDIGVWVFVDIQLYMLESNTYMVDFKCDGYQNVLFVEGDNSRSTTTNNSSRVTSPATSRPTSSFNTIKPEGTINGVRDDDDEDAATIHERKGEWRPISKRFRNKEKEITSPYPYLDVASELIAQLAVSN